ncbi:hypothetical protein SAMN05518801_11192 [Novosphingobium sp. CF614]|nr:hypothetical protein SAMN05518801_11192 [Novosphingobium sp. CF614]
MPSELVFRHKERWQRAALTEGSLLRARRLPRVPSTTAFGGSPPRAGKDWA